MKFNKMLFNSLLITIVIIYSQSFAQKITDIIAPVNLTAGVQTTILISDMYYAPDYNVKFLANDFVDVKFNPKDSLISFKSKGDFEGLTLVAFQYNGNEYGIIVKSVVPRFHKFTFKPEKKYKKLSVFGSYNSWNRQEYFLKDKTGTGVWEVDVPLEAGRYEYKYYADGDEILDPTYKDNASNGMGSFNHVLIIDDKFPERNFLHNAGYINTEYGPEFSFPYQKGAGRGAITLKNIAVMLDNEIVPHQSIAVANDLVRVMIPTEKLAGEKTLRVAVTDKGQVTNIQTIVLFDGKPAGKGNKSFTWYDGIIYSLMTDRFNNGDKKNINPIVQDSLFKPANYNGGDFKGITNKIAGGYFDSLGINALWLSPVYDNPNEAYREFPAPHNWYSGYHGYWPLSNTDVDDHFGKMSDLKELVATAHKHNIKVLLDFVSGHLHEKNPIFKEHPDWFGTYNLPDGRKNLRLWDEYRLTTWFEPFLPKFDYDKSPAALKFISDNAIWWLNETGADGFRHDAVKHVPNSFWRTLTSKLKTEIEQKRGGKVYQIGESFGGYDLISSYVNNGQLTAQFNFNLYDVAVPTFINPKLSFKTLNSEMQKTFTVYGNLHLMGNIMDSHDKIRYMAYADGALELNQGNAGEIGWKNPPKVKNANAYAKAELYLAFMLTIPGVPVIYYGTESGMTGAADPDNRRMMRFEDQLNSNEFGMLKYVSKLVKIRRDHPALRYGDFYSILAEDNLYAYIRSDMNERVLTVLNKKDEVIEIELVLPALYKTKMVTDLFNDEKFEVEDNAIKVKIAPNGFRIFELRSN